MRRRNKVLIGAPVVLVALATAGYWYQRPLLLTGTGYAAHNACALENIAGRSNPGSDLPENPLVPLLRTGEEGAATTTSILGVLARQQAWSTPGYGCTLAQDRPVLPTPAPVDAALNPLGTAPPPAPDAPVEALLSRAFGDDLPEKDRNALGTRAVVVLKDGALVAERYADGFDRSTPQLGWSITKSVTNLLVGRLVHDGQVSLSDDRLREEWTDERAQITLRHLLEMTSGLSWDETYSLGTPITRMLYLEPDMGDYVASRELAHPPGSYLQYSSGSTTLLCDVLAPSRGGADFPRRTLFAPLGLASAVLEPDATGTPVCSSYLWATPRDWAAIGQFALDDGVWNGTRLLPEGWMADSTRAVASVDAEKNEDPGYAAGWWANARADGSLFAPELPRDTYFGQGHDGQWLVVVPSENLVVVRLGFTPTELDERVTTTTAELITALAE